MKYLFKQNIELKYIEFVNHIVASVLQYQKIENPKVKSDKNNTSQGLLIYFKSIIDFIKLFFKIFRNPNCQLFFIHDAFLFYKNHHYLDTFYSKIEVEQKKVYVSYSKFLYIDTIDNQLVYNIGPLVHLISKMKILTKQTNYNNFNEWLFVINLISKFLKNSTIFIPSYSNEIGLSLCFSKNRNNYKLIEVQHGSVINYPPYSFESSLKLVDEFFYKNENDKLFLKNNLFKKYDIIFSKLKSETIQFQRPSSKLELLYVSSFEFDNFHPVFLDLLKTSKSDLLIHIRLHPRQKSLKENFSSILKDFKIDYIFQETINWYDNMPSNVVVISPISSIIEEAVNLNLKTIIIDPLGQERYSNLIDFKKCFYSNDLVTFFNLLPQL